MRTKLTSEQHRFEAARLMDDSHEWKFVYERTGDFGCLVWARAKWLQAKWHERRQQERLRAERSTALFMASNNASIIGTLNRIYGALGGKP